MIDVLDQLDPHPLAARLTAGAASLDERLAAARGRVRAPEPALLERLRPWVQAFSAGDENAFLARLGWDGLELGTVLAGLEAEPAASHEPGWISWVSRIVEHARRPPTDAPEVDELPFGALWRPVLLAARAELERRAAEDLAALAPRALWALEQRLLRDSATIGEEAAYEEYRAQPRGPSYAGFVQRTLADLPGFFAEYPVLARLLATLAETWVAAQREMLARLAADRPELAARFNGGKGLGRVETIEPALGDRHDGGRRVMALAFASGTRLVYKPRDVGLEQAWSALVGWLAARGLDLPPALRVLERSGYGWVEIVEQGEPADIEQVRLYFRRGGALLCLAHVLRGRDLHMENVVASAQGPQLVDTEMLLQPEAPQRAADEHSGTLAVEESCLGTGLLSLFQSDGQGGVSDVGGLRGTGSGRPPIARRVWRQLGSDGIHFVREARFEPSAGNRVVFDGCLQRPDDHADELVRGFEAAYAFLCARRDALLAADGPLRAFAGRPVRVLFRTSTQYGALAYVLTAPRYQRSGLGRGFAMDALNRCFAGEPTRPPLWPLVADERRALDRLDIPRFTVESTSTVVRAGSGEPVVGWFARSGYEAVAARLGSLDAEDCARQVACLRGALQDPPDGRLATPPPAGATVDVGQASTPDRELLVEHARWIGRELLARSQPTPAGPAWPTPPYAGAQRGLGPLHLYDGAAGPALFFSALAAVTGEVSWRTAARTAAAPLTARGEAALSALDDGEPLGAASGLASIAYALGLSGRLLDEPGVVADGVELARAITPARIRQDRRLDVAGGVGGAALVLIALHELCGESWLLDRAAECARRLVAASAQPVAGTRAWPAIDGRLLAGMGHGAAGIAYALARVAGATGERPLLDAGREAWSWERTLYSAAHRNWPVAQAAGAPRGRGGPALMAGWCHGAPGIGLARALGLAELADERVQEEIEQAMRTTLEAAPRGSDHLCCGRFGRVDALLSVGLVLGRSAWSDAARTIAVQLAARAGEQGRFALPSSEFEHRVFQPGFFKGLSGIGYQLLRIAAPAQVPSVLGLRVPRPGGDGR